MSITTLRLILPLALALAASGCGDSSSVADGDDAGLEGVDDVGADVLEDVEAEADVPRPPAVVEGELQFAGVAPLPESVTVRLREVVEVAEPPAPGSDAGSPPPPADPAVVADAVVTATADPYVLSFRAEGLPEGQVYQLGVEVADPAAARLQWRGPVAGLVAAGAPPARFEAVAVRTRLELQVDGPDGPAWVDRGVLRAETPTRTFRWSSDLEDLEAVELQVAVERFPIDDLTVDGACAVPSGLVFSQRVAVSPAAPAREVAVDLTPLVEEPLEGLTTLERARWRQVREQGAPFYLRAVPVTTLERACDPRRYGTSSWVELIVEPEWAPPPLVAGPPVTFTGSYFSAAYPFSYPLELYTCYRVIAAHVLPRAGDLAGFFEDPLGYQLVLAGAFAGGSTVEPGTWVCWRPGSSDGGWLSDVTEAFSDVVGGLVDGVAWMVDRASALYNEIRNRVVDYVAWAVAELTGCEDPCRLALQIAAETGLAAMGLPPSLPDFDQLADQGLDYLAAEIASELGVPPVVVEQAYDVARRMVERAKATRGMPYAPWLIPDSGFRPTVLTLDAAWAFSTRTPSPLLLVGGAGSHWRPALGDLHVPAAGAPPLRMPVVLPPDFTGLPDVPPLFELMGQPFYGHAQRVQVWYEQRWTERFAGAPCVELLALGMRRLGSLPVPEDTYAQLRLWNGPGEFRDPFESQCAP
jgi:hypothetical protein